MKSSKEYKDLSIKEFTKAAKIYDQDYSGIYQTCKKNYPDILEEVKKEDFESLLDVGCGTGEVIYLLSHDLPNKQYVGLDLTPAMIDACNAKNIEGAKFIVGDAENLPFDENSFDIILCSESFHHYPSPNDFFKSIYKVLNPGGKLILRDYIAEGGLNYFANHIEMPLANKLGHGDVGVHTKAKLEKMIKDANLTLESIKTYKLVKMHMVIRKSL